MTMSIAIELERAQRALKITKRLKEARYTVRRPSRSLNDDHHSGKMDILSMYKEMDKLVMVVDVCISLLTRDREANRKHGQVRPGESGEANSGKSVTHERIWSFPWEPWPLPPQRWT